VRVAVNAYVETSSVLRLRLGCPDGARPCSRLRHRARCGRFRSRRPDATPAEPNTQNLNRRKFFRNAAPPREVATGGLTNVPAANARLPNVPTRIRIQCSQGAYQWPGSAPGRIAATRVRHACYSRRCVCDASEPRQRCPWVSPNGLPLPLNRPRRQFWIGQAETTKSALQNREPHWFGWPAG